jgi:hypothetical protein
VAAQAAALAFPIGVLAQMAMPMGGPAATLQDNVLRHMASGTDVEPDSTEPPMLMRMSSAPAGGFGHDWMLMLHGNAELVEQQQTGPRGRDKFFSVNWLMPMAQRTWGQNELTLRTMLSLEPATVSGRYYPELFQQGETAFGKPIVDGQHPHELFMELAGLYDRRIGERGLISIYAGPVGDPALGPVAFPHRASAGDNPLAPLGHHLEDSTHIAYEVVTAGVTVGQVRLEGSGFHGREPDENRWHIEAGALDSWSARATWALGKDWMAQYSAGHLHSPEQVHPGEDVLRQTASVAFHHAWQPVELDALALWGRNHTVGSAVNWNGYLLEGSGLIQRRHAVWTRMENVDRTSDLLGADAPAEESVIGRVQAFTGGYAFRISRLSWGSWDLGAQGTIYETPGPLRALYGDRPAGVAAVLRVQVGR